MKTEKNTTSLVVTTYNWPEALSRVLDGIRRQTVLPLEVIVADDGSGQATATLLKQEAQHFPVPLRHVWHPDEGFRKTIILNKAIAQAQGDYIIEIDGDIIPERHFIQDHLDIRQVGCFVCGSRTKLNAKGHFEVSHCLNSLRCRLLRHAMADRYGRNIGHTRGCNLAFWKADFIAVNGYNEDMTGWGYEDSELAYRLYHHGCRKRVLKFGGIVYHIWHKESSAHNREHNWAVQLSTIEKKSRWCENGISKYL